MILPLILALTTNCGVAEHAFGQPATPDGIKQQIQDVATQYKSYGAVPRCAFFDTAYPKDDADFDALDGNAVLFVAALSQVQDELPLKRVYTVVNGQQIELTPIGSSSGTVESQIAQTLGQYRTDAVYLIPFAVWTKANQLFADFAENRDGMTLGKFDPKKPQVSNSVLTKALTTKGGRGPSFTGLTAFLNREYPGFVIQMPTG